VRADEMHAYDTKDLKRLFGLPATAVRSLTRAGHLTPVTRSGRLHYSFEDLVVLRTASALRAAKIPARRINRTLEKMRAGLPAGETLRKLSLSALGNRIAVREGETRWESETGQYVLGLDIDEESGAVHVIDRRKSDVMTPAAAEELYAKAYALEGQDQAAAIAAYRQCLEVDARSIDARINLGRLLHLAGQLNEAEQLYRAHAVDEPLLKFNLGALLEDLGREAEAIASYQEALVLDPGLADAHFNVSRLYERNGDEKASLRHLLAYRRLMGAQRN